MDRSFVPFFISCQLNSIVGKQNSWSRLHPDAGRRIGVEIAQSDLNGKLKWDAGRGSIRMMGAAQSDLNGKLNFLADKASLQMYCLIYTLFRISQAGFRYLSNCFQCNKTTTISHVKPLAKRQSIHKWIHVTSSWISILLLTHSLFPRSDVILILFHFLAELTPKCKYANIYGPFHIALLFNFLSIFFPQCEIVSWQLRRGMLATCSSYHWVSSLSKALRPSCTEQDQSVP